MMSDSAHVPFRQHQAAKPLGCPTFLRPLLRRATVVRCRTVQGGQLTALDYLIHDSVHRAAPRGVGATKAAGNYSPCLLAKAQAMQLGCHDCIYLDAKTWVP